MSAYLICDLRRCNTCKDYKLPSEFHLSKTRHDGLQLKCKACAADWQYQYNRRPSVIAKRLDRQLSDQIYDGPDRMCVVCGITQPRRDFARSPRGADGLRRDCKECARAKYRVRNSTPEAKAMMREQGRKRRKEFRKLTDAAKDVPCLRCGERYPSYVMDFHHRNPKTKDFCIGTSGWRTLDVVQREIDKCDVLCANCHRIVEWEETNGE